MTKNEFAVEFGHLESAFGEQGAERRQFYFRQFEHISAQALNRAVNRIIELRDDRYGFPLVAEIHTALDEIQRARPAADESDLGMLGFCQRCGNVGLFLNGRGTASLCSCRAGRLKEARLQLGLSARRSEVEERAKKLAPAEPPMHGLHEKHPDGFWESTAEECEIWKAAKLEQIAELRRRREADPHGPTLPDELRRKLLKDTVAGIRGRMEAPADIEDEDIVGF